jgi:hypothetical protein
MRRPGERPVRCVVPPCGEPDQARGERGARPERLISATLAAGPMSSSPRRSAVLLLVAVAMLLVASTPAQAKRKPRITFAGLRWAATCIPGPVKVGETSSYHLEWKAAKAKRTPRRKIVYAIYETTTRGGENYAQPTYTTAPGVTSFDTPQLALEDTYYFVVRARDRMGNEDSNTVEREGQDLCE